MFYSIGTLRLRNAAYLQLMRFIEKLIIQSGLEPLQPLHASLKEEVDHFEDRMKSTLKNPLTVEIQASDKDRDVSYTNLVKIIDANRFHTDKAISQAAKQLYIVVESHGSGVINLSLAEETAVLSSFISEIENTTELSDAASIIGVSDWLTNLKTFNTTCEDLLQQRSSSSLPKRTTKEIRQSIAEIFNEIKNHTVSHITFNTDGDYVGLKDEINQRIKEAKEKLK